MGNYNPLYYVDVITNPCPNLNFSITPLGDVHMFSSYYFYFTSNNRSRNFRVQICVSANFVLITHGDKNDII